MSDIGGGVMADQLGRSTPWIVPAALAAVLLGTAPPAVAQTPTPAASAALAGVEKSVVLVAIQSRGFVEVPYDEGPKWEEVQAVGFCTGWFASEHGHIVTAGHCVDPAEGRLALLRTEVAELGRPELLSEADANWAVEGLSKGSPIAQAVEIVQPKQVEGAVVTDPTPVQVVNFRPFDRGDLAVLKLDGQSKPAPALAIAAAPPAIGDPLTAVGFPGSVQQVVDGARVRASFKSGTASQQQVSPSGVAGTEVNADISPGMSGGPTVDAQGRVLGINSFTISGEGQNFNFITDAVALRDYVRQLGIDPVETAAAPTGAAAPAEVVVEASGPGLPVVLLLGSGVALVALVAAVAGLLLLRRNRRPAGAITGAPPLPWPTPAGTAPPPAWPNPAAPPPSPGSSPGPVCQNCGDRNAATARFCGNCGRPLIR
jgi:serine protease Do